MTDSAGRHVLLRYVLLQIPDVALAGLVVVGLWNWMGLPGWAAVAAMVVWVAKDVAIYPLVRRSFSLGESEWVGVGRLIGARGVATVDLSPSGWVRVEGELWRAEANGGEISVPGGTRVRVREVRGMTLVIEPDTGALAGASEDRAARLKRSATVVVEPPDGSRGTANQATGGDEVPRRRGRSQTPRRPLG